MNCPSCGVENPEQARFCMGCGVGLVAVTEKVPASASLGTTSSGFVGRQREMEQLIAALEDSIGGRGRLVMLAGEPGIGKTRLAQEVSANAESSGAQVLWGRCYEEGGTPPYWP